MLALDTGVSWAGWHGLSEMGAHPADPMALAMWQVVISLFVIAACMFVFEGGLDFAPPMSTASRQRCCPALSAAAIAYGLWFTIVTRLPAMTASLGVLGSPVIGVIASVLFLGERPTVADIIGFVLIFAASRLRAARRPATVETVEQHT